MDYSNLYEDDKVVIVLVDGDSLTAYIGRDDESFLDIELINGNLGFIDKRYNTITTFIDGIIVNHAKVVSIIGIN